MILTGAILLLAAAGRCATRTGGLAGSVLRYVTR